ncbi:MAG: NAD(P)/FAD-dependent oxidoreductase [Bradymonadia bacterium]
MAKIGIIGAGMAALSCARRLSSEHAITLFEKSRGFGGRICTRRRDLGQFDHGAQYFTARSEAFRAVVDRWSARGFVAEWTGRFGLYEGGHFEPTLGHATRWVGAPRMSALGRSLSDGLDHHLSTRVSALVQDGQGWSVQAEDGSRYPGFDRIVVTCPGPQAKLLIPESSPLNVAAAALEYAPCWALMCTFSTPVTVPYDGFHINDAVLSWAARDSSKPGRPAGDRWVIHASPTWSEDNLELDQAEAEQHLLNRWQEMTGSVPDQWTSHRWRYALSTPSTTAPALFDSDLGIGLCGDAVCAPKVEGAWQSGQAMATLLEADLA